MNSITLQERRTKWQELIEEQEKSGLSQDAFCKLHNLVFSNFTYYRSKFRGKAQVQKKPPGTFTPVSVTKSPVTHEIRLSLPNGFQCSLPLDIDPLRVKELLEVILSC